MEKLLLMVVLMFIGVSQLYAYLDPGTGSMIIQGIVASIVVLGVFFKSFWSQIKNFILKNKKIDNLDGEDDEKEE